MVPQAKASVAHSEMRHAALRIGGLSVFEDIAHTSQGSNQRLQSPSIHLAAKAINMHIDHVGIGLDAHSPDLIENHGASDNAAGVAAEVLEEDKLLRRELEDFAGAGGLAAKQVELEIENAKTRRLMGWGAVAADEVAQPGEKLGERER